MNGFSLTDAVSTILSLFVNSFVPIRFEEDDMISLSDVETSSTTLKVDEENFVGGGEFIEDIGSFGVREVTIEDESLFLEVFRKRVEEKVKRAIELREDKDFVIRGSIVDKLNSFDEFVGGEERREVDFVIGYHSLRVNSGLSKPSDHSENFTEFDVEGAGEEEVNDITSLRLDSVINLSVLLVKGDRVRVNVFRRESDDRLIDIDVELLLP